VARAARRSSAGFSLIEALVSMSLFLMVLLAVLLTYSKNRELYTSGERKIDVQQNARLALASMAREIRMAGYFPENFTDPPASPALANPLRVATDATLAIYGDADGSGASSVFLYCLDGETLRRGKADVASVDAYTCGEGEVMAESAAGLQFTYYDDDNNPVPSPPATPYELDGQDAGALPDMSDTTERGSIRRIVITLTTREERMHGGPLLYTLTSDVVLRNNAG
jgi:Tfp pilus assembly protein PilW